MILVNEEASKRFPDLAKSNYDISLLDQSGKKVLKIKKILDAGIATDNIMTTTVRLFVESNGSSSITVEKIKVYKFNNGFEKLNYIINETQLPIKATINGTGFIDIPVGVMDEEVDIIMATTGTINKLYAAVNGYINNLNNKILELLKDETSLTVSKSKIVILKGNSASFTVQAEGNNYSVITDNTIISSVSKNNNTVNITSFNKTGDCNIIVEAQVDGKKKATKIVKLLIIEKPSLYIEKNNFKLLVNENEPIIVTPSSQADFKVNIDRSDIVSFDKNTKTITSKAVATEGTNNVYSTITLTPVREEIEGNSVQLKVKVLKPFIKINASELDIEQETSKTIELELSKDTDYSVNISNTNAIEYDKTTRTITAKNIVTDNVNITFTPSKDGVNGDAVTLVVNVVTNKSIKDTDDPETPPTQPQTKVPMTITPKSLRLATGQSGTVRFNVDRATNINLLSSNRDIARAQLNSAQSTITVTAQNQVGNANINVTAVKEGFLDNEQQVAIEVVQGIQLSVNNTSVSVLEGGSATVQVTTNATEYTATANNDKVQISKSGNTLTLQTTRGNYGNSVVTVRAQKGDLPEATVQINVTITRHSYIEITPVNDNDTINPIFQLGGPSKTFNIATNVNRINHSRNNNNVTGVVTSNLTPGGVLVGGSLTLNPKALGWSNQTLSGQKTGSTPVSVTMVCQVVQGEPYFRLNPNTLQIPNVGGTATVRVETNWLGNVNVESTNREILTSTVNNKTITITGRGRGTAELRVWMQHQEARELRINVRVGQ